MKIGIVVSQWNTAITDKLLHGAETGLRERDISFEVFKVPGAFEIPLMAAHLAGTGDFDGLIALGVVVAGETNHYNMICRACTDGILRVMLDHKLPIVVFNLFEQGNLKRVALGEKIGTIVRG